MTAAFIDAANSSATPEWPTPPWLAAQLAAEFGPWDLDPAATAANAKAALYYTVEDDGLAQPWKGRVWLNPPYGRAIGAWMAKVDADSMTLDERFFPNGEDFRGLRVHQARLQGGDASSDSYCFVD